MRMSAGIEPAQNKVDGMSETCKILRSLSATAQKLMRSVLNDYVTNQCWIQSKLKIESTKSGAGKTDPLAENTKEERGGSGRVGTIAEAEEDARGGPKWT